MDSVFGLLHGLGGRVAAAPARQRGLALAQVEDAGEALLHLRNGIGAQDVDRLALALGLAQHAGLAPVEGLERDHGVGAGLVAADLDGYLELARGLLQALAADAEGIDAQARALDAAGGAAKPAADGEGSGGRGRRGQLDIQLVVVIIVRGDGWRLLNPCAARIVQQRAQAAPARGPAMADLVLPDAGAAAAAGFSLGEAESV